jgi:hypothetical protein
VRATVEPVVRECCCYAMRLKREGQTRRARLLVALCRGPSRAVAVAGEYRDVVLRA